MRYTDEVCGRIVRDSAAQYQEYFGLAEFSETQVRPRFNIAPTQMDVIVLAREQGRRLEESRWGLIPVWAKDPNIGSRMINARSETLLEKGAFRNLVGTRRCVVPASGFYEWQRTPARKVPYYIYRADGAPMALAGLYTFWRNPSTEEWVTSHTIVTCGPSEFMAPVHNRMPVILAGESLDLWLDAAIAEPAAVMPLLRPCPDDWLARHPVSTLVNNVRNDDPRLVEPVQAPLA